MRLITFAYLSDPTVITVAGQVSVKERGYSRIDGFPVDEAGNVRDQMGTWTIADDLIYANVPARVEPIG